MSNLSNKTIINFVLTLMIVSLFLGCKDPKPNAGPATPARQLLESNEGPTINASDAAIPVISITMPVKTNPKKNSDYLLLGRRDPQSNELHPVHGTYHRTEDSVSFTPSFPLLPNQDYEAVNLLTNQSTSYRWNSPNGNVPALSISPSHEILPANHLKFYLRFSEPMQQDSPWEHCKLLDVTTGDVVPRPFRHTELWNKSGDRLTVWFHPGRQKTGVNLNVEIGPILEPDHEYQLIINADWPSLAGTAIGIDTKINFVAGQPDHSQPDPESWDLIIPSANTREPLTIRFHEPLDYALLNNRALEVVFNERPLESHQEISKNGLGIRIIPLTPWIAGRYHIQINPRLEDLAGNSIERPFEVDLKKETEDLSKAQRINFTVNP